MANTEITQYQHTYKVSSLLSMRERTFSHCSCLTVSCLNGNIQCSHLYCILCYVMPTISICVYIIFHNTVFPCK